MLEDWKMTGLDGGGHVSVNLWTHFSGRVFIGLAATVNLTPEKARALGALLIEASDRAEAESDTLSWDAPGACDPPFISDEELKILQEQEQEPCTEER